MKKENFIELLKTCFAWCAGKGCNNTLLKVIFGALFGIACALFFASCSLSVDTTSGKLDFEILTVERGLK